MHRSLQRGMLACLLLLPVTGGCVVPPPPGSSGPPVAEVLPADAREFARQMKVLFDVFRLALVTDSSRLVTVFVDTTVIHNITHNGYREDVLAELRGHEEGQFGALGDFLTALAGTPGLRTVAEGHARDHYR